MKDRHTPFQFFQERVGKTLLFNTRTWGSAERKDRKKFLNVRHGSPGYSTWREFKWDHCLLLEVYDWCDPICNDVPLLSDKGFYSGFEVAAKIYVDSDVHLMKVRIEDFADPPGEDENV